MGLDITAVARLRKINEPHGLEPVAEQEMFDHGVWTHLPAGELESTERNFPAAPRGCSRASTATASG
jgi:hypothetical protein